MVSDKKNFKVFYIDMYRENKPRPLAAVFFFFDESKWLEQSWKRITKGTFLQNYTEFCPVVSEILIRRFFKFLVKKSIFSSCDPDMQWTRNHLNNFERGPTKEHSCEVWSKSNQKFRRRCCLKIVDGQMDDDDGRWVITIAHLEPLAQVS